ncbi:hypothetical protein [Pseudomonas sp. R3-18-08]|uniref:hypothetical protein n=1 Tax=Pseudomonas sp. R3-18-08 TaxID=1173283 RepID=UPI000F568A2E|nr:hypothetical protein [Pseudomonas sp. R3-18-08]
MISFNKAADVALENITSLVKGAKNPILEGAIISDDEKLYEVTYSYEIDKTPTKIAGANEASAISTLAGLLGKRREYKVFLVDAQTGKFRGFKNYKEQ